MAQLTATATTAAAAATTAANTLRRGLDRASNVLAVAAAAVAASLSDGNNVVVDPQVISRVASAASHHGVAAADLLAQLPAELERVRASADYHLDGWIAAARTPEFWQRTLGNALEASVYAAAITAVDQLLVHRDALLNGHAAERHQRLLEILQTSGLMAAGALPVSVFLAVALMLVPGLTLVLGPLGVIGTAGLGLRLISSAVLHPSQQERQAVRLLRGLLQEQIYALQRDSQGQLTITVRAEPVG